MATTISPVHSRIAPRDVRALAIAADHVDQFRDLARIGIALDDSTVRRMRAAFAGDAFTDSSIANSVSSPVQFLQTWLPGFVYSMTQPRTIDRLIGMTTVGAPEDEEIVQPTLEHAGNAQLYGDHTNYPLAGVGNGYERRTVVRFELGLRVNWLEDKRAGRASIDVASEKRVGVGIGLDIARNRIGFYGFNNGANRTYGFLNDPGLPAYVTVAAGAGGVTWALKTYDEVIRDITTALGALQTSSRGLVNIKTDPITLAVSLAAVNELDSKLNALGTRSVAGWLKETYPSVRVEASVDLDGANAGANVFYVYAERVADSGTDSGLVFQQFVPTKFQTIGTETDAKGYGEDSINATAGVMVTRPYAVRRYTGI